MDQNPYYTWIVHMTWFFTHIFVSYNYLFMSKCRWFLAYTMLTSSDNYIMYAYPLLF